MSKAGVEAARKRTLERERLWPGSGSRIFPLGKTSSGFTRIPRVLPLAARLMDQLQKANAGSLYQALWARDWGQGIVNVENFREILFESGSDVKGLRAERSWREKIKIIRTHGFIKTSDHLGAVAQVLLLNPYSVVLELRKTLDAAEHVDWLKQFDHHCTRYNVKLNETHTETDATSGGASS